MATDATAEARKQAEIEKKSATIRRFWELVLAYQLRIDHLGEEMVNLIYEMLIGLVPHLGELLPDDTQRMPTHFVGQKALKLDPFREPWPIGCRAIELYLTEDGSWLEHGLENDWWVTTSRVKEQNCWVAFIGVEGGLRIALEKYWREAPIEKELKANYERQLGLLFQLYQARMILQVLPLVRQA